METSGEVGFSSDPLLYPSGPDLDEPTDTLLKADPPGISILGYLPLACRLVMVRGNGKRLKSMSTLEGRSRIDHNIIPESWDSLRQYICLLIDK